ncbi:MAG: DUF853 family protein [Erysipelotrichaceae bacterium]|nr:DUF853 family protein [Erysipelotrichaceae bacterium]
MIKDGKIKAGASGGNDICLLPEMSCRHGLITGATGTGKTVTLKVLAEGFSQLGVPVFLADVKGDISSLAAPGKMNDKISSRLETIGENPDAFDLRSFPVRFWDVMEKAGIPVRATVSDMGPVLLGRLMNLSDAQQGVLNALFMVSDDLGWELLDFKDLKAMIQFLQDNRQELSSQYGNLSSASVNSLLRAVLELESQQAEIFFGEPDLDILDWMETDEAGLGRINILSCKELIQYPKLYAAFLLWMLSELNEQLEEAGDLDKPKIVLFFDEAHLMFKDMPKTLLQKIEQTVKLIRSKGVGVFFISQSPSDLPDEVLAQLQNRVQHALHGYTPKDQKAIKAAAQSYRPNPAFDTAAAIQELGSGEALVSFLDENGAPSMVERTVIAPPQSSFDALSSAQIQSFCALDPLFAEYREMIDNESAYEKMMAAKQQAALQEQEALEAEEAPVQRKSSSPTGTRRKTAGSSSVQPTATRKAKSTESVMEKTLKKAAKSATRTIGRDVGKKAVRGILGNSKSTASRAAANFAGNIAADLFGSIFK